METTGGGTAGPVLTGGGRTTGLVLTGGGRTTGPVLTGGGRVMTEVTTVLVFWPTGQLVTVGGHAVIVYTLVE